MRCAPSFVSRIVIVCLLCSDALLAQTDCEVLSLANGTLQGFNAQAGTWYTNFTNILFNNNTVNALATGRHTVRTPADGLVPWITAEPIAFVPPGKSYAVQLGNMADGKQWERLLRTVTVDSFNTLLKLEVAVFLEDKGHVPIAQPKFWLKIYDAAGAIIPCGSYEVNAGNIAGFKSQPAQTIDGQDYEIIRYLPWTPVSVDLRAFAGQQVTVELTTFDCPLGDHAGCALFAIECQRSEIVGTPVCAPGQQHLRLSAPEGFGDYQWSNGATTREIVLTDPVPGETFTVTFAPLTSLTGSCTVSLGYTVPPAWTAPITGTLEKCPGLPATLATTPGYAAYQWSNGDTTSVTDVVAPGVYAVTVSDSWGCTVVSSATVSDFTTVEPQLSGPAFVCPDQTATLTCTPGYAAYQWSNGGGQPQQPDSITVTPGLYRVTVIDANGCVLTDSIAVGQYPVPPVTLSSLPGALCGAAGQVVLQAMPPGYVEYAFSTGETGAVNATQAVEPGPYSVIVRDSAGCTNSASVTVLQSPDQSPVITGAPAFCSGQSTVLTMAPGAPGSYDFQWSNGATSPTITVDAPGAYACTITDALGCSWAAPVLTVVEHALPAPQLTGPTAVCEGATATVAATPGYSAYAWSNQSTAAEAALPAGLHTLTVTDQNGCTAAVSISIAAIPWRSVALTAPALVCAGVPAVVTLAVAPASGATGTAYFAFNGQLLPAVAVAQDQATFSFVPTATGVLTLTSLQLPGYDCPLLGDTATVIAVDSVRVRLEATLHANGLPVSCHGAADGTLTATTAGGHTPLTFQWQPAVSATAAAAELPAGQYALTVTDAHGCSATDAVDLAEPAALEVAIATAPPKCWGVHQGVIDIEPGPGVQGAAWATLNDGAPQLLPASYDALPPGWHAVSIVDALGCTYDTTITFAEPVHTYFNVLDTLVFIEIGDAYRFTAIENVPGATIHWTPTTAMADSTTLEPLVSPLTTTLYEVRVTTPDECTLPADRVLVRVRNSGRFYAPNAIAPGGTAPNNAFFISAKPSTVLQINTLQIYDRWGSLVYSAQNLLPNDASTGWHGLVRGKPAPPGVYVWRAEILFADGSVQRVSGDVTIVR